MNRFTGKAWLAVAGVAIVLAMTHVAEAQREGRGRGGGGRGGFGMGRGGRMYSSQLQLAARVEAVQDALKLTDEQQEKIGDINAELMNTMRDLYQQGGGEDAREERQKATQAATAKLAETLDADQQARLLGIAIQVNGAAALLNEPSLAEKLEITDDQREELTDIADENRESELDAMQDLRDQDLSREEMRTKMNDLRTEADKKLLAALSTDQQAKFESLKGEKVEIDRSQLGFGRGGRGGGRGGREGGFRERGGRNRGDREGGAQDDRGA